MGRSGKNSAESTIVARMMQLAAVSPGSTDLDPISNKLISHRPLHATPLRSIPDHPSQTLASVKPLIPTAVRVLVTLLAVSEPLFAQDTPGGYGLAAPWPSPVANPQGYGVGSNPPTSIPGPVVSFGEPVDPLTGLPLRMTSLADREGSASAAVPAPPPPAPLWGRPVQGAPIGGPVPFPRQNGAAGDPDAAILPPIRPVPIFSNPSGSPALLNGQIDPLEPGESAILFPTLMDGDPAIPLPQLDPPLFEAGNGDGELDWIDLIEEYAGRATHSDIYGIPADTPPEDRSWLRLAHFRADAFYVAGSGDALGMVAASGSVTFGLAKVKGVTIRPGVTFYGFDSPTRTDVSTEVHDLEVEVAWMHRFNECWRMRVATTGGLYSDFEGDDISEEFRLSGVGLVTYEKREDLQFVLGAAFVNVESQRVLPVAGIVWFPDEDNRLELIYPEGRIATKVHTETERERWMYLSGGYFGRTWRTQRTMGGFDDLSYSHWRVAIGWETTHLASGVSWFVEGGFAVGRDLEYSSGLGNYTPQPRVMLRAGFYF